MPLCASRALVSLAVTPAVALPPLLVAPAWAPSATDVTQRDLRDDLDALFEARADNIFLVKLSYWIGL